MLHNEIGRQRLRRQKNQRLLSRTLAVFCLLLAITALILLPGWFKAAVALALPLAVIIERRGANAYDQLFYAEREKEQLAQYVQRGLPAYRMAVNQPLGDQVADLLLVGPPGIFVVCFGNLSYDSIDENVDRQALAVQAAAQRVCSGYPVTALIYARQMSMLRPAVTRLTAVHSPAGIIDHVNRSRVRCNNDEIAAIAALLGWKEEPPAPRAAMTPAGGDSSGSPGIAGAK